MATVSDVEAKMEEVSRMIKVSRQRLKSAKAEITTQETNLNAIPTRFSDLIATINGYTPNGAFEELYKDQLSKLTAEFQALVADATLAKVDLANRTEF